MLAANGGPNDPEVENLSGKISDMSFGAPLNIQPSGATSRTGGKRSSRDAENESGSAMVPCQMERQQSSITTPNVSTNLSDLLTNCRQVNYLCDKEGRHVFIGSSDKKNYDTVAVLA